MQNTDIILKAESYVERRKLFKNVWDAAMLFDDKEGDGKSKVIKTIRNVVDKRRRKVCPCYTGPLPPIQPTWSEAKRRRRWVLQLQGGTRAPAAGPRRRRHRRRRRTRTSVTGADAPSLPARRRLHLRGVHLQCYRMFMTQQLDGARSAARRKKQRLANLRHVCTKILDFCDKQEAEDVYREQLAAQGIVLGKPESTEPNRRKIFKIRRKIPTKKEEPVMPIEQVEKTPVEEIKTEDVPNVVDNIQDSKQLRKKSKVTVKRKSKLKTEQQTSLPRKVNKDNVNKQIALVEVDGPGDGYSQVVNISKTTGLNKKGTIRKTRNSKVIKRMSKKSKLCQAGLPPPQKTSSNAPNKRSLKRTLKHNIKINSFPTKQKLVVKSPSLVRAWAQKA